MKQNLHTSLILALVSILFLVSCENPTAPPAPGGTTTEPPAPSVAVTSIALNTTTLSLARGTGYTLTGSVSPANATNKAITWSTSNPAVVTVDQGTVSAVGLGSATITARTEDGNKTATCAISVVATTFTTMILTPPEGYVFTFTQGTSTTLLYAGLGLTLDMNLWTPGYTSVDAPAFFYFYAEAGKTYLVNWDDSYEGAKHQGVKVSTADLMMPGVYSADGLSMLTNWNNADSGLNTGKTFSVATDRYVLIPAFPFNQDDQYKGTFLIKITQQGITSTPRTKFTWFLNGAIIPSTTTPSYILDSSSLAPGRHRLTVQMERDGTLESAEYEFTKN